MKPFLLIFGLTLFVAGGAIGRHQVLGADHEVSISKGTVNCHWKESPLDDALCLAPQYGGKGCEIQRNGPTAWSSHGRGMPGDGSLCPVSKWNAKYKRFMRNPKYESCVFQFKSVEHQKMLRVNKGTCNIVYTRPTPSVEMILADQQVMRARRFPCKCDCPCEDVPLIRR